MAASRRSMALPFLAKTPTRAGGTPMPRHYMGSPPRIAAPRGEGAEPRKAARRVRGTCLFSLSVPRLPLGEREDVGDFAALVRPGIDRPQRARLALLDHCRVVRTLGEQEARR